MISLEVWILWAYYIGGGIGPTFSVGQPTISPLQVQGLFWITSLLPISVQSEDISKMLKGTTFGTATQIICYTVAPISSSWHQVKALSTASSVPTCADVQIPVNVSGLPTWNCFRALSPHHVYSFATANQLSFGRSLWPSYTNWQGHHYFIERDILMSMMNLLVD